MGVGLSSQVRSGRTRKWPQVGVRRFRLDIRKNKIMERDVKHLKRLPI